MTGTWQTNDQVTCPHVLAARLAVAFGKAKQSIETEDQFKSVMMQRYLAPDQF